MKKLLIISALLVLFIACEKEEKKPDYLWPEEQFVEVLTEFQKTESLVRLEYHRFKDSAYANDSVYAALYEKMEVEEEEFDSNYYYYLRNPEKLEKIYEEVITRISETAGELEGAQKENQ